MQQSVFNWPRQSCHLSLSCKPSTHSNFCLAVSVPEWLYLQWDLYFLITESLCVHVCACVCMCMSEWAIENIIIKKNGLFWNLVSVSLFFCLLSKSFLFGSSYWSFYAHYFRSHKTTKKSKGTEIISKYKIWGQTHWRGKKESIVTELQHKLNSEYFFHSCFIW